MRKLALSDEILLSIEKPARYIGNEVNSVMKDKEQVDIRVAFCFPDAYEIGYKSVGEMAQRLEHRFYRLKGHKTEIKVFDRDEFSLNDNLERFLYSYE